MSLREVLDALVGSAPFERLLLERARPIVAKVDAGQDAVLAGLAVALDAPLLVVTPGPREVGGARPRDRRVPGPGPRRTPSGVGRPAVRGDGPGARGGGSKGRRDRSPPRPPRDRSSSSRRTWPRCRRLPPTLGTGPIGAARRRRGAGAGRARGATVRARLRPGGRGRASGRVRRPGWRRRRVPRHRATARAPRVLGRRDRARPRVLPVDAAVDETARWDRGRTGARAPARRRAPRGRARSAPPTSPTGSATGCSASPTVCVSKGPTRSRRSCSTTCPPRRSSCPPAAGWP